MAFLQLLYLTILLLLSCIVHSQQTTSSNIVIVGAGTSGCILAGRLCSALPFVSITLLERGLPRSPNSDFLVRAPRKLYDAWFDRTVTEAYSAERDAGINNRATTVLTGGTLGGTSAIGGFQWTVPLNGTVEKWGIKGLTTSSAVPFYEKTFIQRQIAPPANPLIYADDFVRAAIKAGYPVTNNGLNQPETYVWQNRVPIDSEFRKINTCKAYVEPVQNTYCARNLKIVQGVTASKLILSTVNGRKRVTGVETLSTTTGLDKRIFYASSQVLLTSGPYNSPKLLQLSGIGSASTLRNAGIQQQVNLPVGEATICGASLGISSTYTGMPDEPANNLAFVNSPQQRAIWDAGNGGILATPPVSNNGRNGSAGYFTSNLVPFFPGPPTLTTACYPDSRARGYVRIRNSNPFSTPMVKYNLLGEQGDVDKMKKCLSDASNIHRNFPESFKMRFTSPPNGEITDAWIRQNANTGAHLLGGCPVGDVLTDELKLKGVDGIRVIDGSSLRTSPVSSGPVASIKMVAEYMSEVIRKEFS